jgi:hypothetical protein
MYPEDVFCKYERKETLVGDSNYSGFETSSAVTTVGCPINLHLERFLQVLNKLFSKLIIFNGLNIKTKMTMVLLLTADLTPYFSNC